MDDTFKQDNEDELNKVFPVSPTMRKKRLDSPKKRPRAGSLPKGEFTLDSIVQPKDTKKGKKKVLLRESMPINFAKQNGNDQPRIEKKESGEKRKKKDGINRKFIRKNAKKGVNQKKKYMNGNNGNKIKVVGKVSNKLNALIQQLTKNTEEKPVEKIENPIGEKVVIAPRIKAALEKFNKKADERPKIYHYGEKGYRRPRQLRIPRDNQGDTSKDNISTEGNIISTEGNNTYKDDDYEYEEYEDEEEEYEEEIEEEEIQEEENKEEEKKEENKEEDMNQRRARSKSTRKKKSRKEGRSNSVRKRKVQLKVGNQDNQGKNDKSFENSINKYQSSHFDFSDSEIESNMFEDNGGNNDNREGYNSNIHYKRGKSRHRSKQKKR